MQKQLVTCKPLRILFILPIYLIPHLVRGQNPSRTDCNPHEEFLIFRKEGGGTFEVFHQDEKTEFFACSFRRRIWIPAMVRHIYIVPRETMA